MEIKRKRKRIRGLLRALISVVALCIVLLLFFLLGKLLDIRLPEADDAEAGTEAAEETETVTPAAMEAETEEQHVFTVFVDAGHGGTDGGAGEESRLEKHDNLKLSMALKEYLESNGVNVVMTREDDSFLSVTDRPALVNSSGADYCISLHRNTGDGYGVEIWISSTATPEEEAYAENIMAGLEAAGISRNRGVKKGSQSSSETDLVMNRETEIPSCLVELGFMYSGEDNSLYDEHLNDYAKAIGDALINTYTEIQNAASQPVGAESGGAMGAAGTITGEGSTDPEGNVTSIAIQNTPLDVGSYDASLVEWGSGGNVDNLNRPVGCTMYEDKYAGMSAYFLGPTSGDDDKVVYLTFDIGYTNEYTSSILDTLKEKDAKGVFFATLEVVQEDTDICNRIISEGHQLGNHSVTHTNMAAKSVEEQQSEIMQVNDAVLQKYNYQMHLWRYPEGKFSQQGLAIVNNCNYRSVFWSFAHRDWVLEDQPDVMSTLQKCVDSLHPGAIYLLHGISPTNAALLPDFIDQARAKGYRFELLQ